MNNEIGSLSQTNVPCEERREVLVKSIQESEERLRLALEAADIGIWDWNLSSGEFTWSDNIEKLLGIQDKPLQRTYEGFLDTIHPQDRRRIDLDLKNAIKNCRSYDEEFRIIRHGNEIRWMRIRGNVYQDQNGRVQRLMGSIHDKTERKLALESLQNAHNILEGRVAERTKELSEANIKLKKEISEREKLQKEIMEISEREQQRIGQDLHDSLSQQIGGIIFMSQVLKEKLVQKNPDESESLQKIIGHLNNALKHTRDLSRGLFPVLERGGFDVALKELSSAMADIFHVTIDLKVAKEIHITDRQGAIHIFRVVQEAINNAIKHGQASKITILLTYRRNQLILEIKDNGAGFPKMPNKKGMGLNIMKYRLSMINAQHEIKSRKGKGTTIRCYIKNPEKLMEDSNES